jgi:hypothetical protein
MNQMARDHATEKKPHYGGRTVKWLARARVSAFAALAGFLGGVVATGTDVTEKIFKLTDRLEWTRSEQVILAEDSAKSRFSDALIRASWRRLFLAELFARRVSDASSIPSVPPPQTIQDINEAWDKYVSALTDWNGDLMINIVGLEHYYDAEKSQDFEFSIQGQFATLDTALRELRLSNFVQKARAGDKELKETDRAEIRIITASVFREIEVQRRSLYFFVRCFSASKKGNKPSHCDLPTFLSEDIKRDPTLR